MPKVTIDGSEMEVPHGITVLQACELAGKEIPRFCYHERLSIAGNCRMCLVEISPGPPKPAASCALPVGEGMDIKTDSDMVKKARNGVMELLLINHPLDCPICDQGGECDLQDQAMAYGHDRSRFEENKRSVKDKNMGPLVKTIMTRCIHCTRCVRFATEIAGVPELGMLGRGENAEITSYLEKSLESELSANVIDLCPVGALTSKPYAFVSRPWELTKTESIDVMDAVGSSIRIDSRQTEVLRVLPRLNEEVNEEWVSDKARFAIDGLKKQRLDKPYIRIDGKLREASWQEAFTAISNKIKSIDANKIAAIVGDQCDAESMIALKDLMEFIGSKNIDCRQDGAKLSTHDRSLYLLNSTIAGMETADSVLFVGTNLRWEAPLINSRLRKAWINNNLKAASIGPELNLTYPVDSLGSSANIINSIAEGNHPFSKILKDSKRPAIILGMAALARPDGLAILNTATKIADNYGLIKDEWNGFNVLHTAASRVGALYIDFVPGQGGRDVENIISGASDGDIDLVYLLGADEIDTSKLGKSFVIYQGHHGDAGAHRADIILPGAAYTEKNGTYVNTEGRVQITRQAVQPPGNAREDWTIIRALSDVMGADFSYNSLGEIRQRLTQVNPLFDNINEIVPSEWNYNASFAAIEDNPIQSGMLNYYMTCPISRASETMAKCSQELIGNSDDRTGTNG
jgi:NADH-quinone oxidoreductase subunit G